MIFFGRHLSAVIERTDQGEAEFRAAVDAFRDESESAEAPQDVSDQRQTLQLKLQAVLLWWREYAWQLVSWYRALGGRLAAMMRFGTPSSLISWCTSFRSRPWREGSP